MRKTSGFGPTEPFTLEGQWWVPGAEHRRVGGVLEYDLEDGLQLRLFNALSPPDAVGGRYSVRSEGPTPPVIHGQTFDGPSEVTLLGAFGGSPELPEFAGSYQNQSFMLQWALLGAHVPEAEPVFRRCWMSVTGCETWAGPSGLGDLEHDRPATRVAVRWEQPEPVEVTLDSGVHISLQWQPGARGDAHTRAEIRPFPSFESTAEPGYGPADWLRIVGAPLRDLSSLMVQAPMQVESFVLEVSTEDEGRPVRTDVVYNAHQPLAQDPAPLPVVQADAIELARILERWFALRHNHETQVALSRFFASGYRSAFLEHRVSDVAAILEALPLLSEGLPDIAPSQVREELLQAFEEIAVGRQIDRGPADIIRTRLKRSIEPTLKQHVTRLTAEVHEAVSKLIRTPSRFASRIRDVRNPLAHGEALPIDVEEAFWLARAGHFVITAVILTRLGVEQSRIAAAFSRLSAYRYACDVSGSYDWGVKPAMRPEQIES